jgi:protein TonB
MASLSLARPGNFSARRYIGDLAGLFERQRRRAGVALTPESFAADLAGNDTLRSSLFSLCSAISRMAEHDLSPEELLDLVARALGGAGSAEGESGTPIPEDMREAFLSGYAAWQNRDLQATAHGDAWPPAGTVARKPPMREPMPEAIAHSEAAAAGRNTFEPATPASGHRTVQEALGLARNQHAADLEPGPRAAFAHDSAGSMTLGELKHFLDEMEHRAGRIGPHVQQLNSAAQEPERQERERPTALPGSVIPFPDRRGNALDGVEEAPQPGFNPDASARRRSVPTPNLRVETDARPPGIDALLAAAPAWAKATPAARSVDEEAFLSRHAYLSPARRPGTLAPASLYYAETPAQPLAPPSAALPADPPIAPVQTALTFTATTPAPPPPRIGLDAEDDPLLSPMERLQTYMLRLPPRRVFLILAGLTVFAGGLAGLMAYRTLHGHVREFKDLEPAARFGVTPPTTPASAPADSASAIAAPAAAPVQTAATPPVGIAVPRPEVQQSPVATTSRSVPHSSAEHLPPVAVWPPIPQQIAHDTMPASTATASAPATPTTGLQPLPSSPFYIPAPTMIGYALATPQPAYPAGLANGISGTVSVEVTVSRLGDVTNARAVGGPPELRAAAVSAVRGWRFRPYLIDGRPVAVSTTLQFFFSAP